MGIIRAALFVPLFFLAGIHIARADLPPPGDYVEECTVARKEQSGTTCEQCKNSYKSFQGDDPCKTKYAETNFEYVCKGWGASVWTEVWCAEPACPDDNEPDSGCSYTHSKIGEFAPMTLPIGLGIVVIAVARKRRRDERSQHPRNQ